MNNTDRMEKDWQQHLAFEMLIADLATTFIDLPVDKLHEHIGAMLGRIGEFLGFDRATLFQMLDSDGQWFASHAWARPGYQPYNRKIFPAQQTPWLYQIAEKSKQPVIIRDIDDLPPQAKQDQDNIRQAGGMKAIIVIPLIVREKIVGSISFGSARPQRSIQPEVISRMSLIGAIIAGALERQAAEVALQDSFREVKKLKDMIQAENLYLQKEIKLIHGQNRILGRSPAIRRVLQQIEQVAGTNATVLILGETGTGKDLVARSIHDLSGRKNRTLVCVNCAALTPTLIESELFGHEKGAFTGAVARQAGRFEVADGSTIFLDEIGDLPVEIQVKLLRVLQDGRFERLGSSKSIKVDARILSATNRDLAKAVREGRFREDLYYRLHVFPIIVPPLRDRLEDIPLLVEAFVSELSKRLGKNIETVPLNCIKALQNYAWPGNLRELRNVIERAIILADGPILRPQVPIPPEEVSGGGKTLEEVERNHIRQILESTGWRVSGERGAAKILGMNPKTLESRMKKIGILRPVPLP